LAESPWLQTYLVDRFIRPKKDASPPSTVTDLRVRTDKMEDRVILEWSAPDDNNAVRKYQVKYAEQPMKEQILLPDESGKKTNFWAAHNVLNEPSPSKPGELQTMVISGLTSGKTYYFALRSYDYSSNRSELSNQPSVMIPVNPRSTPD